jgi:hypothetical protein
MNTNNHECLGSDQLHQRRLSPTFGQDAMPVAKPRRSEATSCFAFINVTHPDEIRERSTQRAIRSGAMAAIGRARRKRPEKPVIVELNMPHTERLMVVLRMASELACRGLFTCTVPCQPSRVCLRPCHTWASSL